MQKSPKFQAFVDHSEKLFYLKTATGLLGWDQQTIMPKGALNQRGSQLALLESIAHEMETDPKYFELIQSLVQEQDKLNAEQRAAVRRAKHQVGRKHKIPKRWVEEFAKNSVESHSKWQEARAQNRYSVFLPSLKKMIDLSKEYADFVAEPGQSKYEALLSDYEPFFPAKRLKDIFAGLKKELVPIVKAKADRVRTAEEGGITPLSIEHQKALGQWALKWMGFDFDYGRLDISAHPFCGGGGADTRMTTRYAENFWRMSFYGTMHECGHGLYEQGMEKLVPLKALRDTPGMGMHESQSRLWENTIGRSREFAELLYKQAFDNLGVKISAGPDALYKEINTAERSYIRVEADELTYNLHIMLRFEIEEGILSGTYRPEDLPEVWWTKLEEYLGLPRKEDSMGVLQDVHWSGGAFGYFPSYTLGNLMAAQFVEKMGESVDWKKAIAKNQSGQILDWLRTHIHSKGAMHSSLELVEDVTGKPLSHEAFIRAMVAKF